MKTTVGVGGTTGAEAVTVIVCTRDRPGELEGCLSALSQQTLKGFDLLVVDNGVTKSAADICRRWNARHVREPRAGSCFARNTGAREARGEIIASVDDDAIPESTWLETLLRGFADPRVVCVTGRIRYLKQAISSRAMSDEDAPNQRSSLAARVFSKELPDWFSLACFGAVGDASNMAFRRKQFLESPGFDNRLGRGRLLEGGDEHIAFMSILAMGHRIAYVPDAVVKHPYPASFEMVKARVLRDRRTAMAYLIFLWIEFPAHRGDLLRFLGGAIAKRALPRAAAANTAADLGYWDASTAALGGLRLYLQARSEWKTIPAPDYGRLALVRSPV